MQEFADGCHVHPRALACAVLVAALTATGASAQAATRGHHRAHPIVHHKHRGRPVGAPQGLDAASAAASAIANGAAVSVQAERAERRCHRIPDAEGRHRSLGPDAVQAARPAARPCSRRRPARRAATGATGPTGASGPSGATGLDRGNRFDRLDRHDRLDGRHRPDRLPDRSRRSSPSGLAVAPANAPAAVREAIDAGNQLIGKPYVYGGGHKSFISAGYDCSGAVSFALHGGGLLASPLDSTDFETWGLAGAGTWITIYTESDARVHGDRRHPPGHEHRRRPRRQERTALATAAALARGFRSEASAGVVSEVLYACS